MTTQRKLFSVCARACSETVLGCRAVPPGRASPGGGVHARQRPTEMSPWRVRRLGGLCAAARRGAHAKQNTPTQLSGTSDAWAGQPGACHRVWVMEQSIPLFGGNAKWNSRAERRHGSLHVYQALPRRLVGCARRGR